MFILSASIFAAASLAIAVYDVFQEKQTLQLRVSELDAEFKKLQADNFYKKDYYNRLLNDEQFARRIIRETLGYSGERETIFKFDEKTFSAVRTESANASTNSSSRNGN